MSTQKIKIFIASANEVSKERKNAILLLNDLRKAHTHLDLESIEWEYDTIPGSQPGFDTVQDAITPKLAESDFAIFIFYSRIGRYTQMELDVVQKLDKKYFVLFKKGFSPSNKEESEAYEALARFKESLEEKVMYEHYENDEGFAHSMYRSVNLYLSKVYSTADLSAYMSLPLEVSILIRLLDEKENKIKELEASTNNTNEIQKLNTDIINIRAQLANSEELRQQQAADKAILEKQLASQRGNDILKAQALEAVEKGAYAEAETFLKESVKDTMATTAATFYELAKLKELQLQYRQAFEYYELAAKVEIHNSLYLHEAGAMAMHLGYIDNAIIYFEKTLLLIDESSYKLIALYNDLGEAYRHKGKYESAIVYQEKGLSIYKSYYGESHPKLGMLYNNLGLIYRDTGEYNKAIEYYEQALVISREFYGPIHPGIAICYNNLGTAYSGKFEHKRAIKYYEQALDMYKVLYPKFHPHIADTYNNIGAAYHNQREYNRAIHYYEQALVIDKVLYGEHHPNIAMEYGNLGLSYYYKQMYEQALPYFKQALSISIEFLPLSHPDIAFILEGLALTKEALSERG